MGKTATNISIVLGIVTIAYAGYYLFTNNSSISGNFNSNEQTIEDMVNNNRIFSERRQVLESIELEIGFFEDSRFRSLQTFTKPIQERPVGRPDPFADAVTGGSNSF